VRALAAQLRLELALVARNGESLLLTIGIPVAVLVFFSLVDVLPIDGEAVEFLAPGTLAMAVLATAFTNLAISTGFDRSYGVLKRLGTTPLGRPRLVAAKALAVLVVIVVQVVVIGLTALALGWEPDVEPVPLAGAVFLAIANAAFVALLLLSGMVFPLDELPSGLRAGARSLPSTALTDAARGALTAGADVPGRVWPVLAVWGIASLALAIALFRWEPSD
jgi:ABC-2 type transport system permease protein